MMTGNRYGSKLLQRIECRWNQQSKIESTCLSPGMIDTKFLTAFDSTFYINVPRLRSAVYAFSTSEPTQIFFSVDKMVEEASTNNKHKTKAARPKPVCLWTVIDVLKWYRRHCNEYPQYCELFQQHEISGRALLRLNDSSLKRMGIISDQDREAIWREITKQKLKTDYIELSEMTYPYDSAYRLGQT